MKPVRLYAVCWTTNSMWFTQLALAKRQANKIKRQIRKSRQYVMGGVSIEEITVPRDRKSLAAFLNRTTATVLVPAPSYD